MDNKTFSKVKLIQYTKCKFPMFKDTGHRTKRRLELCQTFPFNERNRNFHFERSIHVNRMRVTSTLWRVSVNTVMTGEDKSGFNQDTPNTEGNGRLEPRQRVLVENPREFSRDHEPEGQR